MTGASADLILKGGAVYTVDAARSWAQAVAVRGGKVTAVGADSDVKELAGPRTEVIDLQGRMVLPGFQDAHVHPIAGGLNRLRCDLSDLYSREAYFRAVTEYAESHLGARWILGGGWAMGSFPGGTPRKEDLDAVVADRPAFLPNRDGHSAWVNSRALALAGITSKSLDPPDGRIERDPAGEPSGVLHGGAMRLLDDLIPPPSTEDCTRALVEAQAHLHSLGITAWQEAIVGRYASTPDCYDAYLRLAGQGRLTAKVVGALWWERERGEEQIEALVDRRARAQEGRFRATSVKIMQDGVPENLTAAMFEPYLDRSGRRTGDRGPSFVDPDALKRYAVHLDAAGFQVHFHAIGDRAIHEALDAVEAARQANGEGAARHQIAHVQVVHPNDLPRFRALSVAANVQPLWATFEPQMSDLTIPLLGPDRSRRQYPFRSLWRSGAVLAFGSDWPVSSPDPLWQIHTAVNRMPPPGYPYLPSEGTITDPFLPEERLDLPAAIAAATIGSAFVNHLDRRTGTIEEGKLADLVVLDRNLFAEDLVTIGAARVLLTLVEGERVYEDARL